MSWSSVLTAFLGSFLTWRFCGMGLGGAGPFFRFHCPPSVVALSGDSGVSTGGETGAPVEVEYGDEDIMVPNHIKWNNV